MVDFDTPTVPSAIELARNAWASGSFKQAIAEIAWWPTRAALIETPLEPTPVQIAQLISDARRAIAALDPTGRIEQRIFTLGERAVVLLAARICPPRRVPRSPELVRNSLQFGTGLQLRSIGSLAIAAVELPFAEGALPNSRAGLP